MAFREQLRRLRERLKSRRADDPVFGSITFDAGAAVWWRDPTTDGYGVRVFAGESGPTDPQRALLIGFESRRSELLAMMEPPLFAKYSTIRGQRRFKDGFPELQRPSDIWTVARLDLVEVMGAGHQVDLRLLFEISWGDPEHSLSVAMKDWRVVDVGKEG